MTENLKQRGRPSKPGAMTPADRAKRYRAKKKAERLSSTPAFVSGSSEVDARLLALQIKYDVEHQLNVELRNALATSQRQAPQNKSQPVREIAEMRRTISELERIVSAYSAEINRLRDEIKSSRKFSDNPK